MDDQTNTDKTVLISVNNLDELKPQVHGLNERDGMGT